MYLDRINTSAIAVPEWPPLEQFHPCDLQTSAKKGCLLPGVGLNTTAHKRSVTAGYYAMIAGERCGEGMREEKV